MLSPIGINGMETDDPLLGRARQVVRFMITGAPMARQEFKLMLMERTIQAMVADNPFAAHIRRPAVFSPLSAPIITGGRDNPANPLFVKLRCGKRWSLKLTLKMPESTYRVPVTDLFGETKTVEVTSMTFMPGYFDQYSHMRGRKRFNQNSYEMAAFYVLAYGEVLEIEFIGDENDMANDLTLAYVVYGEDIAKLRQ